jgi:putative NADH-flavin reductase
MSTASLNCLHLVSMLTLELRQGNLLETIRSVILAVKTLSKDTLGPYFVMVGGTGSLELPGRPLETVLDHRYLADSKAATAEMIERLELSGTAIAESRWAYRNARLAMKDGKATNEQVQIVQENEKQILTGEDSIPDIPLAARAALMMFEGNTSFSWSFLSPPVGYRGAAATGKYQIVFDELPMRPLGEVQSDAEAVSGAEDRLLGISIPDLALAIVNELDSREKAGKHWTAVGELKEDVAFERYARIL